jgi:hypothetical protein
LFAVALGVSDGILNALTLASAKVLRGHGLDLGLGGRVGIVAFPSAVLTIFVAEYAQNRLELVRAERQLMFTRSGRLAATSLGGRCCGTPPLSRRWQACRASPARRSRQ